MSLDCESVPQKPTEKLRLHLQACVATITAPEATAYTAAQAHIDDLTKPAGSLGRIEEMARQLAALEHGALRPLSVDPARLFTIAGDHGVVAEGVNSTPQEVTWQQIRNFMDGGGGINAMCDANRVQLRLVDVGMNAPALPPHPLLIRHRIAHGTANLAQAPAMSENQCLQALCLGIDLAEHAAREGCRCLATGEMGVGNTTPSTALFCALLGLKPEDVVGPGAGLPPIGLKGKQAVIQRALELHSDACASNDPVRILAALGGYEIAALAGLILGGAAQRLPVVIDGFIAAAAFAVAQRLAPAVEAYCVFSHASAEPGYQAVMAALKQNPYLHLDLRLGEGTGAALCVSLLRSAVRMYTGMSHFSSSHVSPVRTDHLTKSER